MSKVLFLVNHDVAIYNLRLEIIERLLEEGHTVVVSSPYGERIEDLKVLGCEYHEIEILRHNINPFKEIKLLSIYKALLCKAKPDIVFSYTIKPNIYGAMACKKQKIPCVANITGLGTALENKGIIQKILILLCRTALKNVQRIFFQNKENMQFFMEHNIAVGKQDLLPGSGVNLKRFIPLEYPEKQKTVFLFIARIMKEKGIDQYLEAAESIKIKYPDTEFHVCGFCEQEYKGRLEVLNTKGIVIYHGMVRDIKTILEFTHCTIHPTYYPEGISNVLLESCACARPIITTDRSGCREVVEDGVNGFVVKQKDSKDLIRVIEKFLALSWEEKRTMGLAGRKKVEKEFDRNIVVEKYMEEIKKLK